MTRSKRIATGILTALTAVGCADLATDVRPSEDPGLQAPSAVSTLKIDCVTAPDPDGTLIASGDPYTTAQSLNSDTPTLVRFTNATCTSVSVYWLNFAGERVLYATLDPGASYVQPTCLTHPWVLVRATDSAPIASFMPIPTYGVARVYLPGKFKALPCRLIPGSCGASGVRG